MHNGLINQFLIIFSQCILLILIQVMLLGIMEISSGDEILGLKEKPTYTYYSNAGIYIIKKKYLYSSSFKFILLSEFNPSKIEETTVFPINKTS